jgi:hypothetical protein
MSQQAQTTLKLAGYNPGRTDGVFDAQTATAVRKYQTANGIPVSGLLDEPTRRALRCVPREGRFPQRQTIIKKASAKLPGAFFFPSLVPSLLALCYLPKLCISQYRAGLVGRTRRQDLVAASAANALASCHATPDVVQDVLQHQAGPHQAHAVAVHQQQEIPARLIDEGDTCQINRECLVRVARLGGAPAVFYLTDPRPGESAFEIYAEGSSGLMDGNLQHLFHRLSRHRTRAPGAQWMVCP